MASEAVSSYRRALERELKLGRATEHTHRPALKALLETLGPELIATNEPKRITAGAPDLAVSRVTKHGPLTVGYVEAKDIGSDLDAAEGSEQLLRYRSLPNLILTDYLEFRWYVDGKRRLSATIGQLVDGRVESQKAEAGQVEELLTSFAEHRVEQIGSPKELARRLAHLSQNVRSVVQGAFESSTASATLLDLRQAFAKALIPDLTESQFADMFAQTIAYGLFAARANHGGKGRFRRLGAAAEIPKTNPLLRQLFAFRPRP